MKISNYYYDLDTFSEIDPQKEHKKTKKMNANDVASGFYDDLVEVYFDRCYHSSDARRKK